MNQPQIGKGFRLRCNFFQSLEDDSVIFFFFFADILRCKFICTSLKVFLLPAAFLTLKVCFQKDPPC